jgi:hypothetical protein
MISTGINARQKADRKRLNDSTGPHPMRGYINRVSPLVLGADTKPSADLGERPEVMWLPKNLLYVDQRYQREIAKRTSRRLIRRLVEEFSWTKFQPITVGEISEGTQAGCYAVIDGQHRAVAALMHPNVDDVPCWVVNARSVQNQARVFVSVNRDRTNIQPLQVYRAQLAAQDPQALRIDRLCREAGITVAYSITGTLDNLLPGQTQAVATIKKLVARFGERPVGDALKTLNKVFNEAPGQLRGQMIEAVTTVFARHAEALDVEHFEKILGSENCDDLVSDARKVRHIMGGSTNGGMVTALLRAYDKDRPAGAKRLSAARPRKAA